MVSLEETLKRETLSQLSGISKASLKTALPPKDNGERLEEFLYGDIRRTIQLLFPAGYGSSHWATPGKRMVQLEESRFVTSYLLRNNAVPDSLSALVLMGPDPAMACLPWALPGIATKFIGFEMDHSIWSRASHQRASAEEELSRQGLFLWLSPREPKKIEIHLRFATCFSHPWAKDPDAGRAGVIDLDFCRNTLRTEKNRQQILRLVSLRAPHRGPFILRTTLHIGRTGNSRRDVSRQVQSFESQIEGLGFAMRAKNESPYQSVLPMLSSLWILERKRDSNEKLQ
jgi:hypothetical protein